MGKSSNNKQQPRDEYHQCLGPATTRQVDPGSNSRIHDSTLHCNNSYLINPIYITRRNGWRWSSRCLGHCVPRSHRRRSRLMFFVVLSGVKDTTPLNKSWFLRVDTSSFPGSGRAESYWTYWKICATGGGQCGSTIPALPFGAAWVGGTEGVPAGLTGTHYKDTTSTYYYYMWRFGWVFYLISIVLTGFTFLMSLLAPCSRLASGLSGSLLAFSLFWFSLAAALMTVTFVKARNEFHSAGITASIGRYAFGFTWGAWAAMFLATLFSSWGVESAARATTTFAAPSEAAVDSATSPFSDVNAADAPLVVPSSRPRASVASRKNTKLVFPNLIRGC